MSNGAFIDPPSHLECATYALQVCPFLAAARYGRRIDDRKLKPGALPDDMALVRTDFMPPALPERFGLGHCTGYEITRPSPGMQFFVVHAWTFVEWWQGGELCGAPDTAAPPPLPREAA